MFLREKLTHTNKSAWLQTCSPTSDEESNEHPCRCQRSERVLSRKLKKIKILSWIIFHVKKGVRHFKTNRAAATCARVARGEGKHGDVDWWLIIERHQQLAAFLGQHGDKKGETRSDFVFAGQDLPNMLWKNTNWRKIRVVFVLFVFLMCSRHLDKSNFFFFFFERNASKMLFSGAPNQACNFFFFF